MYKRQDLVNWTIIGAAVPNALPPIETPERPEQEVYKRQEYEHLKGVIYIREKYRES